MKAMTDLELPPCPVCKSPMMPALPVRGRPRRFQCVKCDEPDPLKSVTAERWLDGLRPPK
jgi:hypothetical protein